MRYILSLAIAVCRSRNCCHADIDQQMVDDMWKGVQELFVGHARALEAQKKWEDAESAWVAAGEPGQAVAMHRQNGNLAAMFRALSQHQPVRMARQIIPSSTVDALDCHHMMPCTPSLTDTKGLRYRKKAQAEPDELLPVPQISCAQIRKRYAPRHCARLQLRLHRRMLPSYINNVYSAQERLADTHAGMAQELEATGDLEGAEVHFVEAGQWQAAADMYARLGSWEDALRVAKAHGGTVAHDKVTRMKPDIA